ncbi:MULTISPECIES: ABC transporter ATP-binding protein [unclassified Ruminococcus]|uniref:ABC transporter ATP-binding protein n=1 Tax=unclassified Ruminococcus TaxID=2608920 RepID=UPI00210C27E6|nr:MULTISPECIES: ABC transporter ATP-binding protein [unclassified Ruminococcus]MCQ4023104.1 ATP-binding cassette domain-containing protein [Ruminococcus sp. zg-924]MCQ4115541.1 ATP-binding cassette domain-containing protein [Ruminococcus sp. zg-921]
MFKLLKYLKDYKLQLTIGPACKLLEAIFELIVPLVMADIIDIGVSSGDAGYVLRQGGVMILLGAVGLCSALVCQKSASIASQGSGTKLRNELFHHINTLSFTEIDRIGTPSLITRMTNDINQLQYAVAMLIRLVIRAPFLVVGAMIMATTINLKLSLIFLVASPLIALVLYFIMSKSVPLFKLIQKRLDRLSLISREGLSGARVIRAFHKEDKEQQRFNDANEELAKTAQNVGVLSALLSPLTYAITNLAIVAIVWFGGGLVDTGQLQTGDIIALVSYMTQILLAMVVVANLVVVFTKASASAARVNEVFELEPSIKSGSESELTLDSDKDFIRFDNVSFGYGGGDVLKNISFAVQKGETVGVIGTTGSGKSSLVNLIPRYYDTTSGSVSIGGNNVKNYPLLQLRKLCSVVMQKAVLFSGTIESNLKWGKQDATDEQMNRALEIAQAKEFVDKLPNKIETQVAQGGKNFSGGQKQRLTIARAIIAGAPILILDDSASALDFATDYALRSAIKKNTEGTTVFIVSQRVATVKDADRILVLDDGELVGYGVHKELFERCSEYREICLSQLSAEEVQA